MANYSLQFSKASNSQVVAPLTNINFPLTLEAWIKSSATPTNTATIVGTDSTNTTNYTGIWVDYRPNNVIEVDIGDGKGASSANRKSFVTNNAISIDQETFISVVATNINDVKIYFDGVLQATTTSGTATSMALGTGVLIGRRISGVQESFDGLIDEVRVWNVALTQEQILQNMRKKIRATPSSLVGYWKFDEGVGTTANDSSISGKNGTISNCSWISGGVILGEKYLLQDKNNVLYALEDGGYTENLIPTMTSNTTPSGVASANREQNPAYRAFDGSTSSLFASSWFAGTLTNGGGWLRYKFPEQKVISKYTILCAYAIISVFPATWTFRGSNDETNWTVLDTRTNITDWVSGEKKEFMFTNSTSYLYYEINISSIVKPSEGNVAVTEMEMMEKLPPILISLPASTPSEDLYLTHGFDDITLLNNSFDKMKILGAKHSDTENGQILSVDIPDNMIDAPNLILE